MPTLGNFRKANRNCLDFDFQKEKNLCYEIAIWWPSHTRSNERTWFRQTAGRSFKKCNHRILTITRDNTKHKSYTKSCSQCEIRLQSIVEKCEFRHFTVDKQSIDGCYLVSKENRI